MKRLLPLLPACLAAALCALFSGCSTVPETGRSQLMLVSPQQETQMGLQSFDSIKKEEKILTDPAVNARIQRIGQRIARSVGRDLPDAQWEFVVFDAPDTINAFALPGGKVGVYTGLINLAGSDDEIAAVMGHEVAHVTSRHGGERISQGMLAGVGGAVVGVAANDSKYRDYWMLAYGGLAQGGILAYSRSHETEADKVGLRFAAGAGYNPNAAVTFWQKMAQKSGGQEPLKWLSTHPPTSERIANLKALAPELMPLYERSRTQFE